MKVIKKQSLLNLVKIEPFAVHAYSRFLWFVQNLKGKFCPLWPVSPLLQCQTDCQQLLVAYSFLQMTASGRKRCRDTVWSTGRPPWSFNSGLSICRSWRILGNNKVVCDMVWGYSVTAWTFTGINWMLYPLTTNSKNYTSRRFSRNLCRTLLTWPWVHG